MAVKKLTDKQIKAASGPARLSDGDGLYLIVRKPPIDKETGKPKLDRKSGKPSKGSKSWSFVWIRKGRRNEMGLGGYPSVSLSQVHILADDVRRQIAAGLDPKAERDKDNGNSFGDVADLVLAELSKTWKHPKHGAQWERALTVLCKAIRPLPISDVKTADVLRVVKPVWTKTPETGRRLRSRIERVLDYATAHGWRDGDNPARLNAHFKILMGSEKMKPRKHYPAMPYVDVPAFVEQLQIKDTMPAKALLFTILTAARTNETIEARWTEIDLSNGLWTIPAERMKAGREHVVPLEGLALSVLKPLFELRASPYVFAGRKPNQPLSNMTMAMTMRRLGVIGDVATVHGFRSSFRDFAGDKTNAPREVAEAALAHTVGSAVERSYRRGDALDKRRGLMRHWAQYCAGEQSGEIVRLHG